MWEVIKFGFYFALGMALLSVLYYVVVFTVMLIATAVGWVIEKAKGE